MPENITGLIAGAALPGPRLLCHYEQHVIAQGCASDYPPASCADVQTRFNGCPSRRRCISPSGRFTDAPIDLRLWERLDDVKKVPQPVVVHAFLDSHFRDGLFCVSGVLYGYGNGFYRIVEEAELIQRLLATFGCAITVADAQRALRYVRYVTRQPADMFKPNRKLVCFSNGVLDVYTGELGSHSPAHRLVTRIDAAYDRTAACRRFFRFLDEAFRDDPDKLQKIQFLRQWMGYLLIADTNFQKMLFLLGKGANGKSLLCKVIEAMVGMHNVSHAMLNRLAKASVRVELAGKLVNISSDLPAQALRGDGYIKSIVSGEPVEAERKYGDSCTIKPFCRLIVATNSMPHVSDTSDGLFRRMIILTFNRQFSPEEQNPNLLDELLGEMEGIVAWAVEGLRELTTAGEFTIPPSSIEALATYRSDVNPVQQFAEECLAPSADSSGVPARDLFALFCGWCKEHGQPHGTSIAFGRTLANLGYKARKVSHTVWLVAPKSGAEAYYQRP